MNKLVAIMTLMIGFTVNGQAIKHKQLYKILSNYDNTGWQQEKKDITVVNGRKTTRITIKRIYQQTISGPNFSTKVKFIERKGISYAPYGNKYFFHEDDIHGRRLVPTTLTGKDLSKDLDLYNVQSVIKEFLNEIRYLQETTGVRLLKNYHNDISFKYVDLPGNTIAVANGMNNDDKIELLIDPVKWYEANDAKKAYIIYHELGHDLFNLTHESGIKMMFPLAKEKYSWNDWFNDRLLMFDKIIENAK